MPSKAVASAERSNEFVDIDQISALLGAIVECGTNGRDDTDCCQSAGVAEACLPLCNGTPPVDLHLHEGMLVCRAKQVVDKISRCWYENA